MPCKITEYTSTEASGYGVDGQNSYRIVEPTYSLGFSLQAKSKHWFYYNVDT